MSREALDVLQIALDLLLSEPANLDQLLTAEPDLDPVTLTAALAALALATDTRPIWAVGGGE